MQKWDLKDLGIDYVRLTSESQGGKASLRMKYLEISGIDRVDGYKEEKGGCFGFYGDKTRHALYGEKDTWSLLQVSGRMAKKTWDLRKIEAQCTRLDLQLTFDVGEGKAQETLENVFRQACNSSCSNHRPRSVKKIEGREGVETVYIGKRASDVFMRAYDKHRESNKEEYRNCVRFEIELKGRASKELWRRCREGIYTLEQLLELVIDEFNRQGVEMPTESLCASVTVMPAKRPTPIEATRQWLYTMLPKSIARVTAEYGYFDVLNGIMNQALTPFELSGIIKLISLNWGN